MAGCINVKDYTAPENAPRGRPSTYKPEYCTKVVMFMAKGKSLNTAAALMKVPLGSFYQWIEDYPDFSEAVALGKSLQSAWYEQQGIENLDNNSYNTSMYKWLTANMLGWSEKQEVKQTVTHEIGQDTANLLDQLRGNNPGDNRIGKTLEIEPEKE